MTVTELVVCLIAGIASLVALVGNFLQAPWVVLVNPIAEGLTIILMAVLSYCGFKRNRAARGRDWQCILDMTL
jgi:hypothetical protein